MLNDQCLLKNLFTLSMLALAVFSTTSAANEESIPDDEKESPNILYVIPWVDAKIESSDKPKLNLHELMGTLYDPQHVESLEAFHGNLED
jgi:hypothetical protein